ncbi:MAG TPA: MFS transporter [Phycisphaerae bacterium]|nr:MFS transporter [Phycisphaerae bacterium]HRY68536.1 MFS transporter [Phycisphaerae bacterium]HSA25584.1 MFS transporter [Phycisphaerae bacterium]
MSHLLVFLFPMIVDMVLSSALFMATVWAAEHGAKASAVANLLSAWSVIYMLASLAIGRAVTRRNAAWLLITACLATAIQSAFLARCSGLLGMYLLIGLLGVTMGLFWTPFQVFMKVVGEGRQRPITQSVGLYTLSWSIGYALGPFSAGFLWDRLGWYPCHLLNAAVVIVVALGVWLVKHHAAVHPAADHQANTPPENGTHNEPYARMPDLAWMGWIFGGVCCMAVSMVRGVFPTTGADLQLSKSTQGLTMAALSASQGLMGISLACGRWWMYRPWPILAIGAAGTVALALFALADTSATFFVAAACLGLYTGSMYFYLVFHSLVHPEYSARYVSINEAMVGLTGIAGPALGGLVADLQSPSSSYLVIAAIVMVAVAVQTALHARFAKNPPA